MVYPSVALASAEITVLFNSGNGELNNSNDLVFIMTIVIQSNNNSI